MQLKDRTFIISGGSSGLGLSTTLHLLFHGANISILDLNPPPSTIPSYASTPATDTLIPLLTNPKRTLFTRTDVSSTSSLTNALHQTLQWTTSTSTRLSGVICCAGIGTASLALPKQPTPTPTLAAADKHASSASKVVNYYDMTTFDRTLSINVRGTVELITLTLPHLASAPPINADGERGVVIVVSSVAAFEGQVGQLAYAASKGAIRSIVLPLAREVGRVGVRVVGVAPGVFESAMTVRPRSTSGKEGKGNDKGGAGKRAGVNPEMVNFPVRMGKGEEFARLCKEIIENGMLNGEVIRLDGGVRMPSRL